MPNSSPKGASPTQTTGAVAPRKQAQQDRSRKRVEQIIEASFELLAEMPSHQINTKLIAKRAGVSIGSLYQFFPNKEAIYYEMFRRWLEATLAALDRVEQGLSDTATPEDCIDAFLSALTDPKLNSLQNWKLRSAMTSTAKLIELEATHRAEVFSRIHRLQDRFGQRPPASLEPQLMLVQNEITLASLYALAVLHEASETETIHALCKKLLVSIYDFDRWTNLPG